MTTTNKGLDSAKSLLNHIHDLQAGGYTWVARYLFPQSNFKEHITAAEVAALHAGGIKLVTVWEGGFPTKPEYFTTAQGTKDGLAAVKQAQGIGQPKGTPIYFAADYDADPDDVREYFKCVQKAVKASGYVAGVYGNGAVCADLKGKGIVSYTWLSQSHGWRGFDAWKSHADIVQSGEFQFHGLDVDADTSNGHGGGW